MQLGQGTALDEAERLAVRDAVLQDLGGEAEVSSVMRETRRRSGRRLRRG